ncbi:NYN domain-containing protein [Ancylothrix sp. D3o]|uniref:IS1/IS1595 family N-terminal zinc-binding domain-containing protein n=1 Tax=Ancylothrix sp. D3o TaxID=2953691 RepID=UPI0021BADAA5|nr:NYN domain-containing protein [Ancylothrix sp. D3o]
MKCPKCESTSCYKNGHSKGRQRYRCKDCGKQFLEDAAVGPPAALESAVAVSVEGQRQVTPAEAMPMIFPLTTAFRESPAGIAVLLLDAENLKLDVLIENFLAGLCGYPLQVKIAFANWRNQNLSKQDGELYDRGYQLIHVPEGKNSADAKMIAVGSSIFLHYPNVREVFVCSSDGLLTHLCNQLQSQGLRVFRVRRQENNLIVENRQTGEVKHYSVPLASPIPSYDGLIQKIDELLKNEQQSISETMGRLSVLASLLEERQHLTKTSLMGAGEVKLNGFSPVLETVPVNNGSKSPISEVKTIFFEKTIDSAEKFQEALIQVLESIKIKSTNQIVSVSLLSAEFHKVYGETANAIVKKLKVATNLTKFLESCSPFILRQNGKNYEVGLADSASLCRIKSPAEFEQALIGIIESLTAKSPGSSICISNIGSEFQKEYGQSIVKTMKQLQLGSKFPKFLESSSAFKVEKHGKGYHVALAVG